MKRKFFIILFSGIIGLGVSGGVLFFLIGNNSATALTSSNVCGRTFTSGGVTASANDWCTNCPDGPYDFCDGNTHYRFSCKSGGFMGAFCDCDTASGGYEVCPGGCASWNCSKGYGCFGGSCNTSGTQTKTCAQLGEWCQSGYTCDLVDYTSQVNDPADKNSHPSQICCSKGRCKSPESNNGTCKAYCQAKGYAGGKCYIGATPPDSGACDSPSNGEWAFCSASQWRQWENGGVWGTGCILPLNCWCAKCINNDSRCAPKTKKCGDLGGAWCPPGQICSSPPKNSEVTDNTEKSQYINQGYTCCVGSCLGMPPPPTFKKCGDLGGVWCSSGQTCSGTNKNSEVTNTTEKSQYINQGYTCCVGSCSAPQPKTCAQLKSGAKCCTSGKVCSSGIISGATDCTECCESIANCVSGCALRCNDSDGPGQVWDVKGTCKEGSTCAGLTTKGTDSCSTDGKTLTEWYCDGTSCKSTTHDCSPDTCSSGKCVTATSPTCGNGTIDSGEQCDGSLGSKTCKDFGFEKPEGLKCKSDCTFDTSGCSGTVPPPETNCPSLDGLTAPGITISGFSWDTSGGQCQFRWNEKVIPGFPSMASHISIPYEWMVTAGFPSNLTATDDVKGILDKWYQLSFINNRLRYRVKYGADHPKLNEILSILSSASGGICEGSNICDLIKKLISEEPLKALDLKLVMHSYNELKIQRAMVECVLSGRCPPHTYGTWGYLLLGKCTPWGACSWPEKVQL